MASSTRAAKRRREEALKPSLHTVLRPIVDVGLLNIADVGRIGAASRDCRLASLDNDMWASLCSRHWPNTSAVPAGAIERQGGYRGWAMKRMDVPPRRFDLGPPPLTADDIMLLVDFKRGGETVVSEAVTGEALAPLLERGIVDVNLSPGAKPAVLNGVMMARDYGSPTEREYAPRDFRWNACPKYCATIHLLYLSDSRVCCVYKKETYSPGKMNIEARFRSTRGGASYSLELTTQDSNRQACIEMGVGRKFSLRDAPAAESILRTLEKLPAFNLDLNMAIWECGKNYSVFQRGEEVWVDVNNLHVGIFSLTVRAYCDGGTDYHLDELTMTLEEYQKWELFSSEEEKKKSGVTLSHLMAELNCAQPGCELG